MDASKGTGDERGLWRQPRVFSLLAIALMAELAYAVLNVSAMPVYLKNDRGFPEGTIGFIIAVFLLSEAVFKGPMGSLADRFGRKRLMVVGPLLTVFTAIATLFVPQNIGDLETFAFVVLRAIDGLGVAMLWPAAFALIGETVGDRQKQKAMSLVNMCYLGGVALAFLLGGVADDLFGHLTAQTTGQHAPSIYLAFGLCLAVSVVAYLVLPSGREMRESNARAKSEPGSTVATYTSFLQRAKTIPGYLVLGAVTFMGIGFPLAIFKLFAQDELKLSGAEFGGLVLPAMIALAALSPFMSAYGEKIGRHKAVHLGLLTCTAGTAIVALSAFIPGLRGMVTILPATVLIGTGFLLTVPAWYASVSELNENCRAANIGAVMTAQGLGAIIGSLLGSQAYERFQGTTTFIGIRVDPSFAHYSPFVGCAACVLFGWLLSLLILRS